MFASNEINSIFNGYSGCVPMATRLKLFLCATPMNYLYVLFSMTLTHPPSLPPPPPPPKKKKHNHLHGIRNTSKVLHMRPIQLSRPIPNPDEMCRRIIPLFPLVFS